MYPYPYFSIIGLLIFVLDIVAIFSVLTGNSSGERKVGWTLAILILPVLGMVLYYAFGRNRNDAMLTH